MNIKRRGVSMLCCAAILLVLMTATLSAHAQASYAGSQDTIISAGTVNMPSDVATDASGNVYVVDGNVNQLWKYTKSNGSWSQTTIGSSSDLPKGASAIPRYSTLSVDSKGNVFAAFDDGTDLLGGIAKFTPNGNGGYTSSVLYTATNGLLIPSYVRVDAADNVLILTRTVISCGSGCSSSSADKTISAVASDGTVTTAYTSSSYITGFTTDSSRNLYYFAGEKVYKTAYSSGAYSGTSTLLYDLATINFKVMNRIAVDSAGNVYLAVADFNSAFQPNAYELVNNSGTYTVSHFAEATVDYAASDSIAVDANDAVYFFCDSLIKHTMGAVTAGTVAVGSNVTLPQLTFNFANNATITSISALTDGNANLDFVDAGTGTCAANSAAVSSCTVAVKFAPTTAGLRRGAVQVVDSTGATATAYIYGVGSAPEAVFNTAPVTVATSAPANSLKVDAAGNLYAVIGAQAVLGTPGSGGYTWTTFFTDSNGFSDFAVDGAGNTFALDAVANFIAMRTPAGVVSKLPTTLSVPAGMAIDGAGNLYVADQGNNRVVKFTNTGSGYTQSTLISMANPISVALDANGNLFIGDLQGNIAQLITTATPAYLSVVAQSSEGIVTPSQLSIDAAGNIYVADLGANAIVKLSPSSLPYTPTTLASSVQGAYGVAVDNAGRLFYSSVSAASIMSMNSANPPALDFGTLTVHSTSSKTLTMSNVGNAALSFTGTPALTPSLFTLDSAGTCPITSSTLAANASCNYVVDFTPTTAGAASGSMTMQYDNLNSANYTSSSALSGTGADETIPAAFVVTNNATFTAGTAGSFLVVAKDPAGYIVLGYRGTVHFTSSDANATLPADYTFTAADTGVHTFSATLKTSGAQTVTVADTVTATETGFGSVTVTAAAPATIVAASGSGQSAIVNAKFGTALVVKVSDAYGNPISGTTVTFAVPASGASATLSATTATTDSTGKASVTATANGTNGSYSVTATAGTMTASFSLTNTAVTLSAASATAISLKQGGTGTGTFTLSGTGTPGGSVTLSCSGLPSGLGCTVSPASVSASSLPTTITVTVTSTAITSTPKVGQLRKFGAHALSFALLMPGMLLFGFKKSRRIMGSLLLLVVVAVMFAATGCGTDTKYTTAGAYTATVTASATGATTLTTNITVNLSAR